MDAMNWMTVLSAVALASWMVAGAMAIFDIHQQLRHPTGSHVAELLMGGLCSSEHSSPLSSLYRHFRDPELS
ncbi:hypothetical protein FHX15_006122 [Rhizobium sp. BK650]|nr:hypothetical protein [Rhizobium sp. BK650]